MKLHRLTTTLACTACLALAGLAPAARASILTTDPTLPPFTGYYQGLGVFAIYNGPGVSIAVSDLVLTPIFLDSRTSSGPDEFEDYMSSLDGNATFNGNPIGAVFGNGQFLTLARGKIGNVTGTFDTEMLTMDLGGNSSLGPFMLRESPTLASLGVTSITDLGGGNYQIDSFFDIFTELSIDGGATWIPNSLGAGRVTLVPEPGTVLLAAFGLGGLLLLRRRAKV